MIRISQFFVERKNVIKFSGRKIEFWVLKDFGENLLELYPTKSAVMVWILNSGRLIFDL